MTPRELEQNQSDSDAKTDQSFRAKRANDVSRESANAVGVTCDTTPCMEKTTIGSGVFYMNAEGQQSPALVTKVHNATSVDLTVFPSGRVQFLEGVKEGAEPGTWQRTLAVATDADAS